MGVELEQLNKSSAAGAAAPPDPEVLKLAAKAIAHVKSERRGASVGRGWTTAVERAHLDPQKPDYAETLAVAELMATGPDQWEAAAQVLDRKPDRPSPKKADPLLAGVDLNFLAALARSGAPSAEDLAERLDAMPSSQRAAVTTELERITR